MQAKDHIESAHFQMHLQATAMTMLMDRVRCMTRSLRRLRAMDRGPDHRIEEDIKVIMIVSQNDLGQVIHRVFLHG